MQSTSRETTVSFRSSLSFDADPRHLSAARAFVAAVAVDAGHGPDAVADLKLAVSEACTNAIRAHAAIAVTDPVVITASSTDGDVTVEVADAGGGFDVTPQALQLPAAEPSDLSRGGLGLGVIRALFPDARIAPNDRGGTTVTLVLRVHANDNS